MTRYLNFSTISDIQFDELQTIEHTKCKPLSVIMAVSKKERKIIAFQVSKMPATGYLASIARKKYGPRKDERLKAMTHLFEQLQQILTPNIRIQSDECRFYKPVVNAYFPQAHYLQFKVKKVLFQAKASSKKGHTIPCLVSIIRLQCVVAISIDSFEKPGVLPKKYHV